MRCEDVLNALNARADGELSSDAAAPDSAALEAHLAECASCRAAADGLPAIDADLRRAFAPRRTAAALLAERTIAKIRTATEGRYASADLSADALPVSPPPVTPLSVTAPVAAAPHLAWGQMLLAMAVGFVLAVILIRPWQMPFSAPPTSLPRAEPVAQLAIAAGSCEMRPAKGTVSTFTCPENFLVERDSVLSTGPTMRCELLLEGGNPLCLDANTEITLHNPQSVEVTLGRMLCPQATEHGLEIKSGGGTITAKSASQLAVECQPEAVRLIVVDGTANVRSGEKSLDVGAGQQVRIVAGKLDDSAERCDALLETAWVNTVLAQRSANDPELAERVDGLLANIGAAKLSYLYEDELRRLGDGGVPPLLAYLVATRETPNLTSRTTAARIVADVGDSRRIADLIELLIDPNPDVRFQAARGLERLTGRDQGCEPQTWKSVTYTRCEEPYSKWLNWWAKNRDRYPASRRELSMPTSPPF